MALAIEPAKDWTFDNATRARVDAVFARWDTSTTPGCALGIYREGEIVYTKGFGMSNLEHGIPIQPDSIFHIASISKQFTDMCVALLASEGVFDVDDDIRLYVPEVPDFGPTITIRHLIHHVSGLRDQWSLLELAGWREEDLVTEADVMDLVMRQTALNFTPNDEYLYSNTGYTLLSMIVRRVSGKTLREFCQERIFGPLEMTRTHFQDDHSEIVKGRTQAYEPRKKGGYRISIPEFDVVGTTSLFTTVEDLAKWDRNFSTVQVGGPEVIAQIQTPGTFNNGKQMSYAWGLVEDTYRGARQIGHGGSDHGYRADYSRFPDFGFTVTCLSNVSDSNPHVLTQRVTDAVLGDRLASPTSLGLDAGTRRKGIPAIVSPFDLAGTYRDVAHNAFLTVISRDGKALLEADELLELQTVGNGTFTLSEWGVTIVPGDISTPVSSVDVTFGGRTDAYVRIEPFALTSQELDVYAGTYWSEELATAYDLVADHAAGALVIRRRKFEDQTIRPLMTDTFGRGSLQMGTVLTFEHEKRGRIRGLLLTAGRIRDLRFSRRES